MKYCKLVFAPRVWGALLLIGVLSLVPKVASAVSDPVGAPTVYSCVLIVPELGSATVVGDTFTVRCNFDNTNASPLPTNLAAGPTEAFFPRTPSAALTSWASNDSFGFQTGTTCGSGGVWCQWRHRVTAATISTSCGTRCTETEYTITHRPTLAGAHQNWPTAEGVSELPSPIPASSGVWPLRWGGGSLVGAGHSDYSDGVLRVSTNPAMTPFYRFDGQGWPLYVDAPSCDRINVGFELENDALTVADYDVTFLPRLSDDVVAVLTVPDIDAADVHDAFEFRYRWGNATDFGSVVPISTIDVVGGAAFTFKPRSFSDQYLSQLVIECAPVADPAERWFFFGEDPGPNINDTLWSEVNPFYGACSNMFVTGPSPSVDLVEGDVVNYPYQLDGDQGVDVNVRGPGWMVLPVDVASYSRLGVQTGGPSPFVNTVAPGRGVLRFTVPEIKPEFLEQSSLDLAFFCSDGYGEEGTRVAGSSGLSFSATLGSAVDDAASCWNTANMSLTSPSSWIAGGARMLGCLARELFVPDSDVLLAEVVGLNETMADRPPFVAFYVVLDFAGDLNDAYQDGTGDGCFAVGQIPGVSSDPTVCSDDAVETSSGQRTLMAIFFTGPMVLGLASHMVGLIRGRPDVIEEANGQQAWNF